MKMPEVNELTEELFRVADNPRKMVNLGIDNIYKYIKQLGLSRQKSKNYFRSFFMDPWGLRVLCRAAKQRKPGAGNRACGLIDRY